MSAYGRRGLLALSLFVLSLSTRANCVTLPKVTFIPQTHEAPWTTDYDEESAILRAHS